MIILIRHAAPLIDDNTCSNKVAQERMNQYNSTEQLKYEEIHAFMNRYIKKQLEKNNWILTTRKKNGCFEIQCLIKKTEYK